jgi:hypothetical protein
MLSMLKNFCSKGKVIMMHMYTKKDSYLYHYEYVTILSNY